MNDPCYPTKKRTLEQQQESYDEQIRLSREHEECRAKLERITKLYHEFVVDLREQEYHSFCRAMSHDRNWIQDISPPTYVHGPEVKISGNLGTDCETQFINNAKLNLPKLVSKNWYYSAIAKENEEI